MLQEAEIKKHVVQNTCALSLVGEEIMGDKASGEDWVK